MIDLQAKEILHWKRKGLLSNRARVQELRQLKRLLDGDLSAGGRRQLLVSERQTEYTAIELFAGCGGMALGLKNAGFKTTHLFEIDKSACKTLRANMPAHCEVVQGDVSNVDFTQYSADILAGGFPCQAFTYAGKKLGFEDTRGTIFFEFARAVKEAQPKIFIGENVEGLITHDKGRTLDTVINTLTEVGYKVAYKLLRGQFHDVPQKRQRIIIIGVRNDLDMAATYPNENTYVVPLQTALQGCPDSVGETYKGRKVDIFKQVPEGGNWRDLPHDLKMEYMKGKLNPKGGGTSTARRLHRLEPSLTLITQPSQRRTERIHPTETRPLTTREYARVQSFPDEWEFCGSRTSIYKQIGNAVPPNLAYHVGRCLLAMLEDSADQSMHVIPWAYTRRTLF